MKFYINNLNSFFVTGYAKCKIRKSEVKIIGKAKVRKYKVLLFYPYILICIVIGSQCNELKSIWLIQGKSHGGKKYYGQNILNKIH